MVAAKRPGHIKYHVKSVSVVPAGEKTSPAQTRYVLRLPSVTDVIHGRVKVKKLPPWSRTEDKKEVEVQHHLFF